MERGQAEREQLMAQVVAERRRATRFEEEKRGESEFWSRMDSLAREELSRKQQALRQKDAELVAQREQIRDIILARQAPSGVTGLLTVLRDLVDAILNTLLPMSSRSDEASSTQQMNSTSSPDDGECPPPGTMNDGMYRPNCPGEHARRHAATSIADGPSQATAAVAISLSAT